MGRAVIIHRDADDMKTQPAGASGERIACGIITRIGY
jgi:Cu-Zn family superoxide dismutase